MVDAAFIQGLVHEVLPQATVRPTDLTGGGDHWHVVIVDDAFAGLRTFQRQRIVMEPFKPHLLSGSVHALDLATLTPEEFKEKGAPDPTRPH